MSADPEAPVTEPDTPITEAPADPTPAIDYQKRYDDLRPEFDRTTQALASERAVWEDDQALRARLAERGWLVEDDDPDPDPDPAEAPNGQQPAKDPRVDEIAQQLERLTAKQNAEQFEKDYATHVGDRTVPKKGREWIEYQVYTNGNTPEALKDAVEAWFADEDLNPPAKPERPRAPHVPNGGPPAAPDGPMSREDRVNRALARMNAEEA